MRYLLFILLLIQIACEQKQQVTQLDQNASVAFQLCQSASLPHGLQLKVQLDTASAEQMVLSLQIRNNSTETISLSPLEAALHTADQRRHLPLTADTEIETLAAGASRTFTWQYRPVNDLYLYQHSGLYGPWQQQYLLPLSFISGLTDTLRFCIPQKAYAQYSRDAEDKKPYLYKPSAASLSAESVARQEAYWQEAFTEKAEVAAGSANFSEQEFFTAGVNVRYGLYHKGDSLYLRLQLVNHTPGQLQLEPEAISVTYGGQHYQPLRITGPLETRPELYELKKGDRVALLLTYAAPAADSLQLSLKGLKAQQQPVFAAPFSFIRQ